MSPGVAGSQDDAGAGSSFIGRTQPKFPRCHPPIVAATGKPIQAAPIQTAPHQTVVVSGSRDADTTARGPQPRRTRRAPMIRQTT